MSLAQSLEDLKNSKVPDVIKDYIEACLEAGTTNRLIDIFVGEDPDISDTDPLEVIQAIERLIELASTITGLAPDTLIERTDFRLNNLDKERFDAMIAELRGVVFLRNEGFIDITPLEADKSRPRADMIASKGGRLYAFEVATSSANAERTLPDLERRFEKVCQDKAKQIESTKGDFQCNFGGVILFFNSRSSRALAFNKITDYEELVQNVYRTRPAAINHLALIAEVDQIVYPAWE